MTALVYVLIFFPDVGEQDIEGLISGSLKEKNYENDNPYLY